MIEMSGFLFMHIPRGSSSLNCVRQSITSLHHKKENLYVEPGKKNGIGKDGL